MVQFRVVRSVLGVLALLAFAGSAEAQQGWRTYVNARFGTTAQVPADWVAQPPPANNDGRTFVSPDGQATIAVFGGHQALDSVAEQMAIYTEANEGETITYLRREATWFAVSGTRGDRIFYRKGILTCKGELWHHVNIDYPAVRKQAFDALVMRVAGSLRAGKGSEAEDCR